MSHLVIGSDHRGYELKSKLTCVLNAFDIGTFSDSPCDYPDIALLMSQKIEKFGILICHTGIGMCISANRFSNLRAALCLNEEMALLSREHNDSNVLVIGAKYVDYSSSIKIISSFLNASFDQRHTKRVKKLSQIT